MPLRVVSEINSGKNQGVLKSLLDIFIKDQEITGNYY
jgi:hypothetical protein